MYLMLSLEMRMYIHEQIIEVIRVKYELSSNQEVYTLYLIEWNDK